MPAAPAPTTNTSVLKWSIYNLFIKQLWHQPDCRMEVGQEHSGIFSSSMIILRQRIKAKDIG
jgi:hypothetical protein